MSSKNFAVRTVGAASAFCWASSTAASNSSRVCVVVSVGLPSRSITVSETISCSLNAFSRLACTFCFSSLRILAAALLNALRVAGFVRLSPSSSLRTSASSLNPISSKNFALKLVASSSSAVASTAGGAGLVIASSSSSPSPSRIRRSTSACCSAASVSTEVSSSSVASISARLASASLSSFAFCASSLAATSPPATVAVPRIEPPNKPPAMAASRYSAIASSLVRGSPACARSRTCCPSSVGASITAPAAVPLTPRVNMPPPPTARLVRPSLPTNKRPRMASSVACGIAVNAAAPSSTSVLNPWSMASFCRSRFMP